MDLIVIYGPPAAGKLTVAKEIANITKYKIFHNHLSVDLLLSIFEFGKGPFHKLSNDIRLQVLETAAKQKVKGVIFTFVYVHKKDEELMRTFIKRLEKHGTTFHFVHLYCDKKELVKRVQEPSRKTHRKVQTVSLLKKIMKTREYFKPFPHKNTLLIDNTNISAKKTAQMIVKHFKLPSR